MKNIELARLIVKQVEAFPELFDMRMYAYSTECGTAACLAGHAMLLSGYRLFRAADFEERFIRPDESEVLYNDREAMRLLGLEDHELRDQYGNSLFSGGQSNEHALGRFKELIAASEQE